MERQAKSGLHHLCLQDNQNQAPLKCWTNSLHCFLVPDVVIGFHLLKKNTRRKPDNNRPRCCACSLSPAPEVKPIDLQFILTSVKSMQKKTWKAPGFFYDFTQRFPKRFVTADNGNLPCLWLSAEQSIRYEKKKQKDEKGKCHPRRKLIWIKTIECSFYVVL